MRTIPPLNMGQHTQAKSCSFLSDQLGQFNGCRLLGHGQAALGCSTALETQTPNRCKNCTKPSYDPQPQVN